jgi:hypothetical protein
MVPKDLLQHPVVSVPIQIQMDPLEAEIVSLMSETVVMQTGIAIAVLGMGLG